MLRFAISRLDDSQDVANGTRAPEGARVVNDVHGGLSATAVFRVVRPQSVDELRRWVTGGGSRGAGAALSLSGGRFCAGGQPFRRGAPLLDLRGLPGAIAVDERAGTICVGAGQTWRQLLTRLRTTASRWTLRQKQTGVDDVTVGGSLSVNAHGRGLGDPPLSADVASIAVMDADGRVWECDRDRHPDRFAHVLGGMGAAGVLLTATLRGVPRELLRRTTEAVSADTLVQRMDAARGGGAVQGDAQFNIDERSPGFLTEMVLSTYAPAGTRPGRERPPAAERRAGFMQLAVLAHRDRAAAWAAYRAALLAADGEVDFNDGWQTGDYLRGYHAAVDEATGEFGGGEVLSELLVPRARLPAFMRAAAAVLCASRVPVIYGNVRLIEPDRETALPWARDRFACVVLNLHRGPGPGERRRVRAATQQLFDAALNEGGSFYLAHHRWARPDQLRRGHPGLPRFLDGVARWDPAGRFESDWLRRLKRLHAAGRLGP